jgi:talin
MRSNQAQPEELSSQLALIMASQSFLQPGSKMVTSAKSTVPTVTDQAAAMQLGQCAKNLATCLAELRTATQKVSPLTPYPQLLKVIFSYSTDILWTV